MNCDEVEERESNRFVMVEHQERSGFTLQLLCYFLRETEICDQDVLKVRRSETQERTRREWKESRRRATRERRKLNGFVRN